MGNVLRLAAMGEFPAAVAAIITLPGLKDPEEAQRLIETGYSSELDKLFG